MKLDPPIARRVPHVDRRHGRDVEDPWHWMRDRSDPAVPAHLERENAYTAACMQPHEALCGTVYDEMVGRIQETDRSAPERDGDWLYHVRTERGKQYRMHCRRRPQPGAEEQLLLDENELAGDGDFLQLGVFEVAPDHELLAYSVDLDGSERYTVRFKDLRSGELLADLIPDTHYSLEWANDSRSVFYTRIDAAHRPYRVYRHVLGRPAEADELIYEEPDEAFFVGLYKTKSRRFLVLSLNSNNTTELRCLEADRPDDPFRMLLPRRHLVEYEAEHWHDRWFVLTNDGAINFRLVEMPVGACSEDSWREIVAHRPEVQLEHVEVFSSHLALFERAAGLRGIRVFDLPSFAEHRVEFDEPAYTVRPSRNPLFDTPLLRFVFESPVTPPSVFDYDMTKRRRELVKRDEVLGGYDPRAYATERRFAGAADGKQVPITLVYRKPLRRDGSRPLLLYGYGAYGARLDPGFASTRLSLLDRGVIFAFAHVRGGGDLGRPWYDDGKLLRKKNSFADFIACAESLLELGYGSAERLAIYGGSAGGLLVGAAACMRPELFRAVLAKVPFVDVVNTMFDASLPLTVIEREEWGDPRDLEHYEYIRSYSPYDNVQRRDYPEMLVTCGLSDPRVPYWEPAKWVAKLRASKTDDRPLLLRTNMGAGHGGASGRYDRLRELAFEYTFLLTRLGAEAGAWADET